MRGNNPFCRQVRSQMWFGLSSIKVGSAINKEHKVFRLILMSKNHEFAKEVRSLHREKQKRNDTMSLRGTIGQAYSSRLGVEIDTYTVILLNPLRELDFVKKRLCSWGRHC